MTEPIRPILLANFDFVVGGGEVGLLMLAEGLLERGHRPLVVVPGSGALAKGLDRRPIPSKVPEAARALAGCAGDGSLIHTFSARGMRIAVEAKTSLPLLFHALMPRPRPADRSLADAAALVICNSQATARRFGDRGNPTVVYNGVRETQPGKATLSLRPGQKTIGIVGGTLPRKGQLDALPALRGVLAARADVDVALIGRIVGAVGRRLRTAAAESEGRIRLLGFVANVADRLGELALVLVPSRSEGFGRVAVEAMRAGVPVLATRVEGLIEALDGLEDPWLPERRELWGARILQELDSPTHTADELRQAAERFDPERYVDTILDLYRAVQRARDSRIAQ